MHLDRDDELIDHRTLTAYLTDGKESNILTQPFNRNSSTAECFIPNVFKDCVPADFGKRNGSQPHATVTTVGVQQVSPSDHSYYYSSLRKKKAQTKKRKSVTALNDCTFNYNLTFFSEQTVNAECGTLEDYFNIGHVL